MPIQIQILYQQRMNIYTPTFARQSSNSKVLQNQHFLSRNTLNPSTNDHMNITESNLIQIPDKLYPKKTMQTKALEEDYEPAKYDRAMQYKLAHSYSIKQQDGSYRQLQLLEDTKSLKYFGLGPYFYVQFMRRVTWLIFFASIISAIIIYINSKSKGMSNYSKSFSTYLITTTLGNFNSSSVTSGNDAYIVVLIPVVVFFIFGLFYLCWKCHFYVQIQDEEQNNETIRPEKFCIEVQSIDDSVKVDEENLKKIFQNFGPIHQISIIKRHKNKLQYFEKLESMEEEIRQIQLELRFEEDGNVEKLNKLRLEKQELMTQLNTFYIMPKAISAYIHFQYEKSKIDCLNFFKDNYLFDSCSHGCYRNCCCCCLDELDDKYQINARTKVLVKQVIVPAPEDINWLSFQLSFCSKFFRYLFAFFIIIVFLAISCTIIGLCTIYVSTHSSDCDSVTVPSSLSAAQASSDPLAKTCYCNANLLAALTDSSIQSYCSSQLTSIYIAESIQYAIIFTSALTNFLFGFVVDKIVNCTRPTSQSHSLKVKTLVYTIFLIINTIFLPILLYSDIFGFKTSSYFSFLTIISSGLKNFLSVDSLQFYLDYSQIWYRNVSPIFTNYLIFDILGVWLMFIVSKYQASNVTLSDKENKILQKHMNSQITSFQFSPYKEYSAFLMIVFMTLFLSSGVPVLLPLAWANLASRYITNRSLIQYSSTRVDGLGVSFNELPHTMLPVLLIIGCMNAGWMLTANPQIFPNALPFNVNIWDINSWIIMKRELYLPFYVFMAIFILGEYLFYHLIIRFCACICSRCSEQKMVPLPTYTKTFSEHKKTMNILTSYNIKSNDKMRNAITRMEMYINKELE